MLTGSPTVIHDSHTEQNFNSLTFASSENINSAFRRLSKLVCEAIKHTDINMLKQVSVENALLPPMDLKSQQIISIAETAQSPQALCFSLTKNLFWHFLDIRMMKVMADVSEIPAAIISIENFKDTFFSKKLNEVVPHFKVYERDQSNLIVMKEVCDKDMTINELYEHRFFIEKEVLGGTGELTIFKIVIGSVRIDWLLSMDHVYQAYSMLNKKRALLVSQGVIQLSIPEVVRWEGLPILWRGQEVGQIGSSESKTLLKSQLLPEGLEWDTLYFSNFDEIIKLYISLSIDCVIGKNSIQWNFEHPYFKSPLTFGVRESSSKKLVWVIWCVPYWIKIKGQLIPVVEVQQQGIDYDNQRDQLYNLVTREAIFRVKRFGISQFILVLQKTQIIAPTVTLTIWIYDFLHPKYPLPYSSPRTTGLRRMTSKDVSMALTLTNQYVSQFEIGQVFGNEEEFLHYFLCPSVPGYMIMYVVEDPADSRITDMFGFRLHFFGEVVSATVSAIVNTKTPTRQLITDLLLCAKQEKVTELSVQQFGLLGNNFVNLLTHDNQYIYWHICNYNYPAVDEENCCLFFLTEMKVNSTPLIMDENVTLLLTSENFQQMVVMMQQFKILIRQWIPSREVVIEELGAGSSKNLSLLFAGALAIIVGTFIEATIRYIIPQAIAQVLKESTGKNVMDEEIFWIVSPIVGSTGLVIGTVIVIIARVTGKTMLKTTVAMKPTERLTTEGLVESIGGAVTKSVLVATTGAVILSLLAGAVVTATQRATLEDVVVSKVEAMVRHILDIVRNKNIVTFMKNRLPGNIQSFVSKYISALYTISDIDQSNGPPLSILLATVQVMVKPKMDAIVMYAVMYTIETIVIKVLSGVFPTLHTTVQSTLEAILSIVGVTPRPLYTFVGTAILLSIAKEVAVHCAVRSVVHITVRVTGRHTYLSNYLSKFLSRYSIIHRDTPVVVQMVQMVVSMIRFILRTTAADIGTATFGGILLGTLEMLGAAALGVIIAELLQFVKGICYIMQDSYSPLPALGIFGACEGALAGTIAVFTGYTKAAVMITIIVQVVLSAAIGIVCIAQTVAQTVAVTMREAVTLTISVLTVSLLGALVGATGVLITQLVADSVVLGTVRATLATVRVILVATTGAIVSATVGTVIGATKGATRAAVLIDIVASRLESLVGNTMYAIAGGASVAIITTALTTTVGIMMLRKVGFVGRSETRPTHVIRLKPVTRSVMRATVETIVPILETAMITVGSIMKATARVTLRATVIASVITAAGTIVGISTGVTTGITAGPFVGTIVTALAMYVTKLHVGSTAYMREMAVTQDRKFTNEITKAAGNITTQIRQIAEKYPSISNFFVLQQLSCIFRGKICMLLCTC